MENIKNLRDAIAKLNKGEMDKIIDFCSELQVTRYQLYKDKAKPVNVIELFKQLTRLNDAVKTNTVNKKDMTELFTVILNFDSEFAEMENLLKNPEVAKKEMPDIAKLFLADLNEQDQKSVYTLVKDPKIIADLYPTGVYAICDCVKPCSCPNGGVHPLFKTYDRYAFRCEICGKHECICGPNTLRTMVACVPCGGYTHYGRCKNMCPSCATIGCKCPEDVKQSAIAIINEWDCKKCGPRMKPARMSDGHYCAGCNQKCTPFIECPVCEPKSCTCSPNMVGKWSCGRCNKYVCMCGADYDDRPEVACGGCGNYPHGGECKIVVVCDNCGKNPCMCWRTEEKQKYSVGCRICKKNPCVCRSTPMVPVCNVCKRADCICEFMCACGNDPYMCSIRGCDYSVKLCQQCGNVGCSCSETVPVTQKPAMERLPEDWDNIHRFLDPEYWNSMKRPDFVKQHNNFWAVKMSTNDQFNVISCANCNKPVADCRCGQRMEYEPVSPLLHVNDWLHELEFIEDKIQYSSFGGEYRGALLNQRRERKIDACHNVFNKYIENIKAEFRNSNYINEYAYIIHRFYGSYINIEFTIVNGVKYDFAKYRKPAPKETKKVLDFGGHR